MPYASLARSITEIDHEELYSDIPQQLSKLLISIRRHIHMHPELGFQEYQTSDFIREMLEMHGITVHGPIAKTGLYVDIEGELPGPKIGYRADIDALPISDIKNTPYASRIKGKGHLCGHDAHTTIAIGIALLLNRLRNQLHGTVRVFFQPNEEGIPSGAPAMISDGVLDGLSSVYAVHVDPTLETGRIGLISGPITAAADRWEITVRGKTTGHSARPHQSTETIWISTLILNQLYQLVGRVQDARNTAVLTVCRFHAGEAFNVIPKESTFGGTLRCINNNDRAFFEEQFQKITKSVAELYGAQVDLWYNYGSPAVINNDQLIQTIRETAIEQYGEQVIFNIPVPSMGGEDFAHYLQHIPGALIRIGTAKGAATSHVLHNNQFDIDEKVLAPTARFLTHVLLNHLHKSSGSEEK